jgi:glycine dehydrogenase
LDRRSDLGCRWGYGGPHAAYMAVRDALKRSLPGRIVGLSIDSRGSRPIGSRCRPASSISAAKRRPRTSARRRCCWQ